MDLQPILNNDQGVTAAPNGMSSGINLNHENKRDLKLAEKLLQDNGSSTPHLNSVQEIYHQLDDEFENSHSVKSQRQPNVLCGSKRGLNLPDTDQL